MKNVDAELREYLNTIKEDIVTIKHDMNEGNKHLETLINETRQTLQTEMKYMEASLREAISYRKEDQNLAFQQINNKDKPTRKTG